MKCFVQCKKYILVVFLFFIDIDVGCTQEILVSHQSKRDSALKSELVNGWRFLALAKGNGTGMGISNLPPSTDGQICKQKAMNLLHQMKYDLAMHCIDSAIKYDPSYIDFKAFAECIFQKDYTAAIKDFYSAKNTNGNSVILNYPYDFYIGLCHLQLNSYDSSLHYFNLSIATNDEIGNQQTYCLNMFYLGVVYYEMSNYKSANEMLDRSLKTYPKFSDALFYKSLCLANVEEYREALTLCNQSAQYLKEGHSITEELMSEKYPYQISKYRIEPYLKRFEYVVQMLDKIENNAKSK